MTVPVEKANEFIDDIVKVCQKHNLWLSHEDVHGAFLIQREPTEKWLRFAIELLEYSNG